VTHIVTAKNLTLSESSAALSLSAESDGSERTSLKLLGRSSLTWFSGTIAGRPRVMLRVLYHLVNGTGLDEEPFRDICIPIKQHTSEPCSGARLSLDCRVPRECVPGVQT
jgi:hypothetical protein